MGLIRMYEISTRNKNNKKKQVKILDLKVYNQKKKNHQMDSKAKWKL